MEKLRLEAVELEKEVKKAKEEKDNKKVSELHLKAAEIYKKIGDEKNWKRNLANYYSAKGNVHSHLYEFGKSREFFKKAEDLFLELRLQNSAFFCASFNLRTYYYEHKKKGTDTFISEQYLSSVKQFLDRYEEFSSDKEYIWNGHRYWNTKAHTHEKERAFDKAGECYEKSAQIISKIDTNRSDDEYINQYKCLSIANKRDKKIFEEYIDKAVEIAEKKKDEKQKFYLLGLKYDHLAKLTHNMEKRIEYLTEAKENSYRAGDNVSGKMSEFMLLFNLSKNELINGNYREAIDFLNKTIDFGKNVRFPNIIPSLSCLYNEKPLYKGYYHISEGEFCKAGKLWQQWLEKNQKIENTRVYQSHRILAFCSELLGKESFLIEDLSEVENILRFVRENKLGPTLYNISSLTYSFCSLWVNGIKEKETLEKIKLSIIKRASREEVAEDLEHRLEIQRAIEEHNWLLQLPPIFIEKFDSSLYFLNDVLDEYRHTAVREFYILLEKFLEIIVEFNAKTLWFDDWKSELENNITQGKKPFGIFTFGDFIQSLKFLESNNSRFCKDISDELLELLDKHAPIRNKLTHEFIKKLQKFDIVGDTLEIMYRLLHAFPTCIKVISTKKEPWYDVEILWNQLPRRVSLYTEEKLKNGYCYYAEPMLEIVEGKLFSKVIIPSLFKEKLEE